jgi:hypothetical protein
LTRRQETRNGSITGLPPGERLYNTSASIPPSDHRRSTGFPRREADPSLISAAKDNDRIRKLELEVAQLRNVLLKHSLDGNTAAASPSTLKEVIKETPPEQPKIPAFMRDKLGDGLEFKFLRGHNFKTRFFSNAWSAFRELDGIFPFMKETSDEWLRPLNIQRKDRTARKEHREAKFAEPDIALEALLPSKEDTDALVAVYLEQFEQIHRIVHIPTFKKEYAAFWEDTQSRYAAFTALILSMIAVCSSLDNRSSSKFIGVQSSSFQTAEKWVKAVDDWLERWVMALSVLFYVEPRKPCFRTSSEAGVLQDMLISLQTKSKTPTSGSLPDHMPIVPSQEGQCDQEKEILELCRSYAS